MGDLDQCAVGRCVNTHNGGQACCGSNLNVLISGETNDPALEQFRYSMILKTAPLVDTTACAELFNCCGYGTPFGTATHTPFEDAELAEEYQEQYMLVETVYNCTCP